jgi:electron transfer flavoprotein beta subunit
MLHIVVCAKQVPDTTQVRINPETNTLIREGIPSIINPFDVPAIELAVRLKDQHGAHVTILCKGPGSAVNELQKALSFGADDAVLVSDRQRLMGSDTLATSYELTLAIQKIAQTRPVDLVICGKQTIDGDTAQVGPGIATRLGWAQLTYVGEIVSLDPAGRRIRVRRILEGATEVVEAPLPALLTVVKEVCKPRYASLDNVIRGLRYQVPVWDGLDLGVDPAQAGLKGSPTQVRRIFAPPRRSGGEMVGEGLNVEAAAREAVERVLGSPAFRKG